MTDKTDSQLIDDKIAALRDWRGEALAHVRAWVTTAAPGVVEEVKWRKPSNPSGVCAWSQSGLLCTGEIYKDKVKVTFARGAALKDPARLFNASLDGNARRAIDIAEGFALDPGSFQALVREAIALNKAKVSRRA